MLEQSGQIDREGWDVRLGRFSREAGSAHNIKRIDAGISDSVSRNADIGDQHFANPNGTSYIELIVRALRNQRTLGRRKHFDTWGFPILGRRASSRRLLRTKVSQCSHGE